ncbi:thiolase family protein [Clostridium aminobutyricum]|uniref:Acetyl-CoA acetyltransferase n=1 Tax=Clostridium aminobutyricum TaxID=33953 RepID=A0A939DA95_CLOAM|nr:thiolase family protein [Clostridium aminobutyricum]MBN7774106.1 thiolase family protein [Clostridium aminobutyricum]
MDKCVITGAVRTAVGTYLGSLKTVPAYQLGAYVIEQAIKKGGIKNSDVDQVIMGDVLSKTPNLARVSLLLAGLDNEVPGFSVDRQCGSALQAVQSANQSILSGDCEIVVAGGAENMSRAPYYLPSDVRFQGFRINNIELEDSFSYASSHAHPTELLPNVNMGITAENIAEKYGITREAQDAFAYDSQMKAAKAQAEGKFKEEILPVEVKLRKSSFIFDTDEHPKPDTTIEALAKLRPVFKKDGTVTAGNASGMNDGASAVVIMKESTAAERGIQPLVRILATSTAGVDPSIMGMGVVPAIQKVLDKAGLKLEDIDLFEINEAFSAQALGCLIELGMEPGTPLYERVNVNGGAVAHGHALGNSGTRILTTLIYELKRRNVKYGIATLCIGGGQGIAVLVENI